MKTSAANAEVSGAFEVPDTVDDPPPPPQADPEDTVRLPIVEPSIVIERRIALA